MYYDFDNENKRDEINQKASQKVFLRRIFIAISLTIAYVSAIALWYYNVGVHWKKNFVGSRTLFIVGIIYCITYWFFARMYNAHKIGLYRLVELSFSQALAFGIADVCLFGASFVWFHNFEKLHITYFLLAFVIQMFAIGVLIFVCNRFFSKLDEPRKICIIHGDSDYKTLMDKMKRIKYRYRIVNTLDQKSERKKIMAAVEKCEDLYLYEVDSPLKEELIMYCNRRRKEVHVSLKIEEILLRGFEVSHAFDTPFVRNPRNDSMWYFPIVKRTFDFLVSFIAIIILSPVYLLTAIAIKSYDRGPILYKQVRLTKDGKRFEIYKFRSMIPDAEKGKARLASANDDRITPVGHFIRKTRIDELPQLFNILKGDMSIVGPRPERPEIASKYEEKIPEFQMRLKVKAGLTGYAQVYGKYNTTPLDKLKLDLIYITNRSIVMDLKIIFYTLKIIFIPESTEGVEQGMDTAMRS